jgi:hypothetical protein
MGLTSLPILNKTCYVNFWQNMWLNKIQNQNLNLKIKVIPRIQCKYIKILIWIVILRKFK